MVDAGNPIQENGALRDLYERAGRPQDGQRSAYRVTLSRIRSWDEITVDTITFCAGALPAAALSGYAAPNKSRAQYSPLAELAAASWPMVPMADRPPPRQVDRAACSARAQALARVAMHENQGGPVADSAALPRDFSQPA